MEKITLGLGVGVFLQPNKVDSVIQSIKNIGFEANSL
jgi:hypothetical protein